VRVLRIFVLGVILFLSSQCGPERSVYRNCGVRCSFSSLVALKKASGYCEKSVSVYLHERGYHWLGGDCDESFQLLGILYRVCMTGQHLGIHCDEYPPNGVDVYGWGPVVYNYAPSAVGLR